MLKKGDVFLIGLVLVIAVIGFAGMKFYSSYNQGAAKTAVIKQNDKVIKRINLDTVKGPQKIEIEDKYENIILVEKGRIRFEDADCPDLVCVKTGWLTEKGDMAVCLPNRVSIKIEGSDDTVDGVTF